MSRRSTLSRDHQGPRAVLNALERLANGYASDIARISQDLSIAESQLRDYQARLGKPFPHDAYLSELTTLRDQLKAGLSATAMQESEEAESVSQLADKIKTLKAAHTIEAMPQRAERKHAAAEEPVTARIRRRQELGSSPDHAQNDGKSTDQKPSQPGGDKNSADKPPTFQERIDREREQSEGPENSLYRQ